MSSAPVDNPYAPPAAPLTRPSSGTTEFYVVSVRKFWTLYVATLGFYELYWFWRNWKLLRDSRKLDIWPIPRSLFSIFFAHALNREIDAALTKARVVHTWSASSVATNYVVFTLISRLADRLAGRSIGSPYVDLISLACLAPLGYSMFQTQRAANAASADPDGTTNHRLTGANWGWIAFGTLLWLLTLVGILIPE